MTGLENQIKGELEQVLDTYFPKGNDDRGEALMLFAEAMTHVRKTIKAFGGCTKCFGKGYGTQTAFMSGSGDFIGDSPVEERLPMMALCTCDRGKQLAKLIPAELVQI